MYACVCSVDVCMFCRCVGRARLSSERGPLPGSRYRRLLEEQRYGAPAACDCNATASSPGPAPHPLEVRPRRPPGAGVFSLIPSRGVRGTEHTGPMPGWPSAVSRTEPPFVCRFGCVGFGGEFGGTWSPKGSLSCLHRLCSGRRRCRPATESICEPRTSTATVPLEQWIALAYFFRQQLRGPVGRTKHGSPRMMIHYR